MHADILRLDLRLRRRAVIGYTLGIAAYIFVIIALYPAFKDDTSLNALTQNNSKLAAACGATGSLTTPSGWVNVNAYANFLPLIVLVLTLGYGAAALAGQNEDGTLALVATLPVRRGSLVIQKIAALVVHAVVITAVTVLVVLAGPAFELRVPVGGLVSASAGVALLGIDFGLLALAIGALTGSRGVALGVASAIAAASYLVSSLAPVTRAIRPLRTGSLFYWAIGDNQLTRGLSGASLLVLLGVGVVLAVAAKYAFDRLDVR